MDGDGNVIDVDYRSVDKATGEVLSTTTRKRRQADSSKQTGAGSAARTGIRNCPQSWQGGIRRMMHSCGQSLRVVDGGVPHARTCCRKIAAGLAG